MSRLAHKLRRAASCLGSRFRSRKVFVVGRNKTGTTSLATALRQLGYNVAPQAPAERLLRAWARQDYRRLIRFCRWFDAFQDIPFSLPNTYRALDAAFPGSKFILSVRASAAEWYQSLTRFHAKMFGNGSLPTWDQLQAAPYCYPGFLADCHALVYGGSDRLYDPALYQAHYDSHNQAVIDYFAQRPGDLLVVNIAEPDAYRRMCEFLGVEPVGDEFPWKNRT